MPSNQNSRNRDFSKYDAMTNEELEEILRKDAQNTAGSEVDIEDVLYITEGLARRGTEAGENIHAAEAFASFQANYLPTDEDLDHHDKEVECLTTYKPKKTYRWRKALAGVAAAIAIVFCTSFTASAFGINLWDIIMNWTQETFHFSADDQPSLQEEPSKSSNLPAESMAQILADYGVPSAIVPHWVPEGFSFETVNIEETPIQESYLAIFTGDAGTLRISFRSFLTEDDEHVEQSGELLEIYETGGIQYYIFEDNELLQAAWYSENYECYISGPIAIKEMKTIIDSIGRG